MIKKLFSIAAIACFSTSLAQNIELRNHMGTTLINGTAITVVDTLENDANQDIQLDLDATSKYTSSTDIKVKKIELSSTAPSSHNAICWSVCSAPIVYGSQPIVISPKIPMTLDQKVTFNGHLYPKLDAGTTTFRYVWFDVANPTDSAWVDVTFDIRNPNAVGIEEVTKETSIKVYPNPATNFVNVEILSNETNKKIEIINLLGKVVYSSNLDDNSSQQRINTSDLLPGVYFVSITANNKSVRTSKIIITK